MIRLWHVLVVLALAAAFVACGCAKPLAPSDEGRILHILLSNDDGVGAPGLEALNAALRARGHRVTVVAPSGDRSGSGVSLSWPRSGIAGIEGLTVIAC